MDLFLDLIPSDYASAPAWLDAPATIALGHRLVSAAPAELPPYAGVSLDGLKAAIGLLERRYAESQTQAQAQLRRPIDLRADATWSCLRSRLEPYTWLEDGDSKDVAPARALYNKIFPGGTLSFTLLDFNAQWAEANWRIELIEREQQPLLRRLVGDVFVDQVLLWHARYSEMLGIGVAKKPKAKADKGRSAKAREAARMDDADAETEAPAVGDLRRRAQQAIVAWQLTLVTLHVAGHKGARAALRPTDEFRERAAASARSPADPPPAPSPPKEQPAPPA